MMWKLQKVFQKFFFFFFFHAELAQGSSILFFIFSILTDKLRGEMNAFTQMIVFKVPHVLYTNKAYFLLFISLLELKSLWNYLTKVNTGTSFVVVAVDVIEWATGATAVADWRCLLLRLTGTEGLLTSCGVMRLPSCCCKVQSTKNPQESDLFSRPLWISHTYANVKLLYEYLNKDYFISRGLFNGYIQPYLLNVSDK